MQRLDKYLANLGLASRREIPALCKMGYILVNGETVKKPDFKLLGGEILGFQEQEIKVLERVYVILYKSAGYISVDTEGLLLLSNDGQFIHQVISPKRDKEKEYEVWLQSSISSVDCEQLKK